MGPGDPTPPAVPPHPTIKNQSKNQKRWLEIPTIFSLIQQFVCGSVELACLRGRPQGKDTRVATGEDAVGTHQGRTGKFNRFRLVQQFVCGSVELGCLRGACPQFSRFWLVDLLNWGVSVR